MFNIFVLLAPCVCYHIFSKVKVTDWPTIGKIAAHSAYEMFSWYRYLIVSLVFPISGFWSGNLLLIAPFPDLCLLVPFYDRNSSSSEIIMIDIDTSKNGEDPNTNEGLVC